MPDALIDHIDALPRYAPAGHSGTVNVRLAERSFCPAFEMVHGTIAPGGEAARHAHGTEHQVIYVLQGLADVELGSEPPVRIGPGAVVRIPPGLEHRVVNAGEESLRLIVLYSPPLPGDPAGRRPR